MAIPAEQADTAALLARLAGRPPIETHISAVFVGDDTVWKLRKAVRLAFLDFSDLAERERTARREFELNAAAAPGMYRDVVPVTRAASGECALGGTGVVIDWVVRMARVPEADFLDAIAARHGIDDRLLDALADAVAALHAGYPARDHDQAIALRHVALGNSRAALDAGLDPKLVRGWLEGMLGLLAERADWLRARGAAGFVRRTHGDLHLGNMCLWQGRPVAFDALEFDEELATTDIGYDLAFLLMDLEHRMGRPAANRVLNRYLARTGDWGMARGLKPFLSMRAMIRAHVEASRLRPAVSQAYFARARACQAPSRPLVLAIGGLPGTGKSTLARALAPELGDAPGAVVLRSDEIRKRRSGVAPEQRLPVSAYAAAVSDGVFAEIFAAAHGIAASGHAVVADASFLDRAHRDAIERAAAEVPFLGIWLHAPLAELERRVAARTGDASDADVAVLRRAATAEPGPDAWPASGAWRAIEATDGAAALAAVRAALAARLC